MCACSECCVHARNSRTMLATPFGSLRGNGWQCLRNMHGILALQNSHSSAFRGHAFGLIEILFRILMRHCLYIHARLNEGDNQSKWWFVFDKIGQRNVIEYFVHCFGFLEKVSVSPALFLCFHNADFAV